MKKCPTCKNKGWIDYSTFVGLCPDCGYGRKLWVLALRRQRRPFLSFFVEWWPVGFWIVSVALALLYGLYALRLWQAF